MNTGKTIATDTLKNNVMTTKELAEALGVSTETVRTTAKKIIEPSKSIWRVINGGKSQIFDESQATAIKIELQNHSKIAQNGFDTFTIANDLDRFNQPYQKYVDAGYFRVIESRFNLPDGEIKISLKTVVFQKGLDFIRRELAKKSA